MSCSAATPPGCTAPHWSPTTWTWSPMPRDEPHPALRRPQRTATTLAGARISEGVKIAGGRLEPRHLQADSVAVGLVTAIGNIDIVLRPRGFEDGYPALSAHAVTMSVGGVEVHVGGLEDLIVSKRLLRRPKDLDQLPALEELRGRLQSAIPELPAPDDGPMSDDGSRPRDHEPPGLGW